MDSFLLLLLVFVIFPIFLFQNFLFPIFLSLIFLCTGPLKDILKESVLTTNADAPTPHAPCGALCAPRDQFHIPNFHNLPSITCCKCLQRSQFWFAPFFPCVMWCLWFGAQRPWCLMRCTRCMRCRSTPKTIMFEQGRCAGAGHGQKPKQMWDPRGSIWSDRHFICQMGECLREANLSQFGILLAGLGLEWSWGSVQFEKFGIRSQLPEKQSWEMGSIILQHWPAVQHQPTMGVPS